MGVYHTLYKCIRLNCHLFDQELGSTSASPHQSLSLSNIVFVVDHFHFSCWSFENIFPGVPGAVWGRQANPCIPSGITNMKITIIIWKNYQLIICIFRYYKHEAILINIVFMKKSYDQAGVGSFSGGLAAHISHILPQTKVLVMTKLIMCNSFETIKLFSPSIILRWW